MKIIATGATGLIGRHALDAVLARPDVTSVIALVRRPLEDPLLTGNQKLHPVIVDDWLNYSNEVKKACEGAVGCVWGLGNASSRTADDALKKKVLYEYPPAFLNQIAIPLAKQNGRIFRFAYVGGTIFVRDQNARVLLGGMRKAAGQSLNIIAAIQDANPTLLDTYFINLGFVYHNAGIITSIMSSIFPLVRDTYLGAAWAELSINGGDHQEWWNGELEAFGKKLVEGK